MASEKAPLMGPAPPVPPAYYATDHVSLYQPPSEVIVPDRPRNARRRRFWHLFACSFVAVFALHLLLHKSFSRFFHKFRHSHVSLLLSPSLALNSLICYRVSSLAVG